MPVLNKEDNWRMEVAEMKFFTPLLELTKKWIIKVIQRDI
jgi:hypothetical protein